MEKYATTGDCTNSLITSPVNKGAMTLDACKAACLLDLANCYEFYM